MAAADSLTHPVIRDREAFREFRESLNDKVPTIERDVARLRRTPLDRSLIADLFRALHNIKGDAAICKVEMGVRIAHPIETVLTRLREGEIVFSEALAEVILLALDRLEMATEALASGQPIAHLKLPALVDGLERLKGCSGSAMSGLAIDAIKQVTGFRPTLHDQPPQLEASAETPGAASRDLVFFRSLALQLDALSPHFEGRNGRLLRLALETNVAAGRPVDPVQLEAAIHFHDIGMMFLPQSAWLKPGTLSPDDLGNLRQHPVVAAGLLERMPGWSDAARMVLQHHEMPDGAGYPAQLKGAEISPGAKILAIVDAFEAVMLKHSHRGESRSLLRAIAEINACDNQFSSEWIGHFNTVLRRRIERV